MNFYMEQEIFSFTDRFSIFDERGNERFYIEGEVFSFGKKLHFYDPDGRERAFIDQKLFSFLPTYNISIDGFHVAEVVKQFTFFYPTYDVSTSDGRYWKVDGDFFDHEYAVYDGDRMVASVSKDWFTWGDVYRISVSDQVDPILALSIVLVIDACLEAEAHH